MFGFTAELGNVLLDAITFDPPTDLAESSLYYSQVGRSSEIPRHVSVSVFVSVVSAALIKPYLLHALMC